MVSDFIFELGCEELPSGSVWPMADELATLLTAAFTKAQLTHGEVLRFATPRRIAVVVKALQAEQASQKMTRRGPAVNAAFDQDGKPTPALQGFAKSCGVTVEQLTRLQTDKGDWMVSEVETTGSKTTAILPALVTQALASLTIAKPMRWGDNEAEFIRPVHWAVMLFGEEILTHELLGVTTGNQSRGHRFHHPQAITIRDANSYEKQLADAYVIANFAHRRQLIIDQVQQVAATYQATAIMPPELIDEVTSIVEWPQALVADFAEEFLTVPAEALIASMQAHQKCFALKDQDGNLLPHFITVANIASTNPRQVVLGNEKVMRARLSDAAFFFNQDKKQALSQQLPATKLVVFQVKLGSLHDKMLRVKALATSLCSVLALNPAQVERAVTLSKCDLLTGMVGEFPELQGLMGYYYALHDGEDEAVAIALNEQYMPRFAADNLPESTVGLVLSLADRLDTLVGIFGIGQKPTGVKDPFKLRRHALAVVRLLIAIPQRLELSSLLEKAIAGYSNVALDSASLAELKPFILDRLNAYYQSQQIPADLVLAVRSRQDEWLYDMDKRLHALKQFITLPQAAALSAACKRVNNLLSQAKQSLDTTSINERLIEPGAEQALLLEVNKVTQAVESMYRSGDYALLLQQLASLKEPVDAFFTDVMVMVDDDALKTNRLAVLARLQSLLQGVADISMLQLN